MTGQTAPFCSGLLTTGSWLSKTTILVMTLSTLDLSLFERLALASPLEDTSSAPVRCEMSLCLTCPSECRSVRTEESLPPSPDPRNVALHTAECHSHQPTGSQRSEEH